MFEPRAKKVHGLMYDTMNRTYVLPKQIRDIHIYLYIPMITI